MIVFGGGAEDRAVLQGAEHDVEAYVRLQGDMLGVLVANWAESPPHFANLNDGAAQTAG